jgi:hypothetical protein
MDLPDLGRVLLFLAMALAAVGLLLLLMARGSLPRLPGTLTFGRGSMRVIVPIGLSILLSVVLTLVANLFFRR